MMRKTTAILLTWLLAAAFGQQAQQATPPPQQTPPPAATPAGGIAKFSANSQLVIETVTVTDKNGKLIEGLKAEDFKITENNTFLVLHAGDVSIPQKIVPLGIFDLPASKDQPASVLLIRANPELSTRV